MMSNDVRCPRCGTLLISGDCLEQIRDKIADENLGMAKCILACPKMPKQIWSGDGLRPDWTSCSSCAA